MTRICIYGIGAIGGFLAARLADSGVEVTGIARGEQLAAIRERGLTLIEDGVERNVALRCVEQPAELEPQDFVVLTLKSHTAPLIAGPIAPLLGPDTAVVTAFNGFPWWYFHGENISGEVPVLRSVDPGARLWTGIGPERAIGSVVYPAARVAAPGIVEHVFGNRFSIGEPDGSMSPRLRRLSQIMQQAGFEIAAIPNIRVEIWLKLVANAAFNPVSLLSRHTIDQMLDDEGARQQIIDIMNEVISVAAATGIELPVQPERLLELTRPFGAHKTSMLQDFEAGREIELDTIVASVAELARVYDVATPSLDTALSMARQCTGA